MKEYLSFAVYYNSDMEKGTRKKKVKKILTKYCKCKKDFVPLLSQ